MNKQLKKVIFNWLCDNKNVWQRVNVCRDEFRQYIYNDKGEYIIGGKEVSEFVKNADELIYSEEI